MVSFVEKFLKFPIKQIIDVKLGETLSIVTEKSTAICVSSPFQKNLFSYEKRCRTFDFDESSK